MLQHQTRRLKCSVDRVQQSLGLVNPTGERLERAIGFEHTLAQPA